MPPSGSRHASPGKLPAGAAASRPRGADRACHRDRAARLERHRRTRRHLHTAVNTSIGALANLQLPALIREHRPKSDKWPGLILEITENEVVKNVAFMHEIATQLRIYGITLAIDDFGEGFSSFARLRELPFAE